MEFSRGIGRNKSILPQKRSLNSSLLPEPKLAKKNDSTFGEHWANFASQSSQQSKPVNEKQNTPTSNKQKTPQVTITKTPQKLPQKQLPKPIKNLQSPSAQTVKQAVPNLPFKENAASQQFFSSQPSTSKSPNQLASTRIQKLLPKPIQPVIYNQSPQKQQQTIQNSIEEPTIEASPVQQNTSPTTNFDENLDLFDDFDIEALPLDVQQSLLYGSEDKQTNKNVQQNSPTRTILKQKTIQPQIIPKNIESPVNKTSSGIQSSPVHVKKQQIQSKIIENLPNKINNVVTSPAPIQNSNANQEGELLYVRTKLKELETARHQITKEKIEQEKRHQEELQKLKSDLEFKNKEIKELEDQVKTNNQDDSSNFERYPIVQKSSKPITNITIPHFNHHNNNNNSSSLPNNSNNSNFIKLQEQFNLQNKRLQMIVDIFSKDDSEIKDSFNISQFPASKVEELQKKIKRLEKEKIRYRAELKKSDEERVRLFSELTDTMRKHEETSFKLDEERKKCKFYKAQHKKATDSYKLMLEKTKKLNAMHLLFSEEKLRNSNSSSSSSPNSSKSSSNSTPTLKKSKSVESSNFKQTNLSKDKEISIPRNHTSSEILTSPKHMHKIIHSSPELMDNNEMLSVVESYIVDPTSEKAKSLAAWYGSQIDDVTGDPTFQEKTTIQAFAKLEQL